MALTPARRRALIGEWRGLPEPLPAVDRTRTIGDLVPAVMHKLGLSERLRESEISAAWSQVVGDFIAMHSTPVSLREGVLYVRVLQPALHYELEQVAKGQILRKLKQRFGGKTIRDLRFRHG